MTTEHFKIVDCIQGDVDWLKARLGKPCASEFKKILTAGGAKSKQANEYMQQLIAEDLIGEPIKDLGNLYWIERGKMLEPDAVKLYEMQTDRETLPVGFITNNEGTIGCSPDRFIKGEPGLLEIKCPAPQTHVGYIMDGFDTNHKPQVQGQLLITGLEWCEWFAYHPEMPPVTMRMERDEPYIKLLGEALAEFLEKKNSMLTKIKATNYDLAAE